jgi:hypothetical protein
MAQEHTQSTNTLEITEAMNAIIGKDRKNINGLTRLQTYLEQAISRLSGKSSSRFNPDSVTEVDHALEMARLYTALLNASCGKDIFSVIPTRNRTGNVSVIHGLGTSTADLIALFTNTNKHIKKFSVERYKERHVGKSYSTESHVPRPRGKGSSNPTPDPAPVQTNSEERGLFLASGFSLPPTSVPSIAGIPLAASQVEKFLDPGAGGMTYDDDWESPFSSIPPPPFLPSLPSGSAVPAKSPERPPERDLTEVVIEPPAKRFRAGKK